MSILKLRGIELAVKTVRLLHQLLVGALLHDVAPVHDEDIVRVLDGGEPVGDDETGLVLHQFDHGGLNVDLRHTPIFI